MAAHKHTTKLSRADYLGKIERLALVGYSQTAIAERVGVSQPQVSIDLAKIRERYNQATLETRAQLVKEKLEQYKTIRIVAWEAYEQSMKDAEKLTVTKRKPLKSDSDSEDTKGSKTKSKVVNDGSMSSTLIKIQEIVERQGRLPANEYLTTILKTLEAERALLGLDEAVKHENLNVNIDWDGMIERKAAPTDPVEERIKRIEGKVVDGSLPPTNGESNDHTRNGGV